MSTQNFVSFLVFALGIYINGKYINTVCPFGTEIDSTSSNDKYKFESIIPYLVVGKNVLVMRIEVWGHGSFMFPRGRLAVGTAALPSGKLDKR